ncbi:phage tail protein I [Leisingera daeponensis]|uniref:phage tail protein I n=1 Tax=Leisingera daeponensis TaxID=405746 RepID=UPI001C98612A|nr:phage tail protein I [Leisingera daeponensis]MBY6056754.1 phage tail protein I [Leisingera daeponensis]
MSDSLLPHNATEEERALEAVLREAFDLPVILRDIWNPDSCPAELLPWLAGAFSVDDWHPGWSDDAKRSAIREAFPVHKRKGTVGSVKQAVAAAGYGDAVVVERHGWGSFDGEFLFDGSRTYDEPDHWAEYRVYLTRPITVEQAAQVREILKNTAPARCHLKGLFYEQALNLYDAQITYDGQFTHGVA